MPISGGSGPVFRFFEPIDIRLDGGETQILEPGLYTVNHMSDIYANEYFMNSKGHIEIFKSAAWHDWIKTATGSGVVIFWADGSTLRFANGFAPGTFYRLIGVRRY